MNKRIDYGQFLGNRSHGRILTMMQEKGWLTYQATNTPLGPRYRIDSVNLQGLEFFKIPIHFTRDTAIKTFSRMKSSDYQALIVTSVKGITIEKQVQTTGGIILGRAILKDRL